ncbi:SDR family NAD(P)-dependent oxidoreductase [Streptomyces qinzhouensis]|uniref:SDR family oxidoreductase n=1 Tax=Streptomyces qinzhouensis TaxID=2599401 RepID=A0A5B8JR91_9ACTN|nr:SDR family oxidoreductase [Streptomyces qinzhouensis]QDY80283.1 SDR family oxidoreductase [Streptomyces qinzhouensis]
MVTRRRTAVVTGSTRGIGRVIAERLIADGYRCVTTGRGHAAEAVADTDFHRVDFEDAASVTAFAAELRDLRPDILVNNAGINIPGAVDAYSVHDFDRLYAVNLRSPFLLCQAVMPSMKARSWGRIVNITSLRSRIGRAGDAPFCATKFGLDGLTAALGAEGAPCNVLANAVAPGYISTESIGKAFSNTDLKGIAHKIPAGRLGTMAEVAALVAWLVSEENTYMAGQSLVIDGGLTRADTERWFTLDDRSQSIPGAGVVKGSR